MGENQPRSPFDESPANCLHPCRQAGTLDQQAPYRRAKEAAFNGLLKRGDRQSVDLLLGIARTETDLTVRRSSISRLGRLEAARVKDFLKELVNP